MSQSNPSSKSVDSEKHGRYRRLYVLMHDGADGPLVTADYYPTWRTLKGARWKLSQIPQPQRQNYYIVKFIPERRIGR